MKKINRQKPEFQHQPIIVTSFIKFEDLRCMGQQIHQTPETDFKVQSMMMKLLIDTNNHGIDNLDRNELWFYDVDSGDCFPGIEPKNVKPRLDFFREQGGHLFLLTRRIDDRFSQPVSESICVWKIDKLPPEMDKVFQTIPPGFDGLEVTGEKFDPDNYSLLFMKKIN
ncbi:MAG: hypothetical protein ACLQUS_10110 [Desulfobaccales bacterium]